MAGTHPVLALEVCPSGLFLMKPNPALFPDSLLPSATLSRPQCLECARFECHMCLGLHFSAHCFPLVFVFLVCRKAVPFRVTYVVSSSSLSFPNPLQISVSLAQGCERASSSPQPRFRSYAYTQAAYVSTSDPTRSPFPPQVCQHLLSVLPTKELLHPR